jgi:hypothetical protein
MMSHIVLGLGVVGAITVAASSAVAELRWARTEGQTCRVVCGALWAPVSSGEYSNGHKFYICRADAHGEGFRAGFNLEPRWSNHCYVAHVVEEAYDRYDCLCEKRE